jgi:hypothetical protein
MPITVNSPAKPYHFREQRTFIIPRPVASFKGKNDASKIVVLVFFKLAFESQHITRWWTAKEVSVRLKSIIPESYFRNRANDLVKYRYLACREQIRHGREAKYQYRYLNNGKFERLISHAEAERYPQTVEAVKAANPDLFNQTHDFSRLIHVDRGQVKPTISKAAIQALTHDVSPNDSLEEINSLSWPGFRDEYCFVVWLCDDFTPVKMLKPPHRYNFALPNERAARNLFDEVQTGKTLFIDLQAGKLVKV